MIPLGVVRRFSPSVTEHRRVEAEVFRLLCATLDARYVGPAPRRAGTVAYWQHNFFSILFLAVYRALGIPVERRLTYGLVNHSLRGIVTGTDNLLDDEYKEMLPLRLPDRGTRFKSVMHILLFDRFLSAALREAVERGAFSAADARPLERALLDALVPIGEEEAGEEGGVDEILTPGEVLANVHVHKGGNLLRLAFVAPRLVERALARELESADRGIFSIGLALQVIDDVTDLAADLRDRRHNYLASCIRHEGDPSERARLAAAARDPGRAQEPVEQAYPRTVSRVMERAVGEALGGFRLLEQAGFWLTQRQAVALVRFLFRVRGAQALLATLPAECRRSLSGAGADA